MYKDIYIYISPGCITGLKRSVDTDGKGLEHEEITYPCSERPTAILSPHAGKRTSQSVLTTVKSAITSSGGNERDLSITSVGRQSIILKLED